MEQEGFKYYAFISYSHKDKVIAKKLQKFLQSYHLPSKLQKAYPNLPKNLKPVFMDESNLVGTGLQEALNKNLDSSNYIIVICSPASAKSRYVNEEVTHFIELGRKSHIIPLIVDGEPHAAEQSRECFPPALLALQEEYELLGIDMTKFSRRDSFLRVIATMLGLDLDNFISWEARERKKRLVIFSSMAAVFVIIAGLLVWYNIGFFYAMLYDTKTKIQIAMMYYEGHTVKQDYAKALEWYQRAAEDGDNWSQTVTGLMYEQGIGTKQDYQKAEEWFRKAAANDYARAQSNLAVMYHEGLGVEKDDAEAALWYEKAAVNGDVEAQVCIGIMYYEGLGVKQDYTKAAQFYEKAALNGNVKAQFSVGLMYAKGLGVKQNYTKAAQFYEKAALSGNVDAQFYLGTLYYEGKGVEQDYAKSYEWLEKAAQNGDPIAQNVIGMFYEGGIGVKQDDSKALEWYEKAAANGNLDAPQNIIRLKQLMATD